MSRRVADKPKLVFDRAKGVVAFGEVCPSLLFVGDEEREREREMHVITIR